ncbi:hypothetical protein NDU88_007117 [Pleurodeles waltl]|uniref:Uncharacterized protein n=1 Tax=Pleurodeles waltl TaxID=8319 RepID=A0AAV7RQS3_PLEWA|nr:hypothetical protein NDU88_007117 [Pleurodeles waltl]
MTVFAGAAGDCDIVFVVIDGKVPINANNIDGFLNKSVSDTVAVTTATVNDIVNNFLIVLLHVNNLIVNGGSVDDQIYPGDDS